jgi:hypothetical protein
VSDTGTRAGSTCADFERDVELDAWLVAGGFTGGREGFLAAAFERRDKLANPDAAIARAAWFKAQPQAYVDEVAARVDAMLGGRS